MDTEENKNSRLITILREGVGIIQMIFFKELKTVIKNKHPQMSPESQNMLTGAITGELFGTPSQEEKFIHFRKTHWGDIEQELITLAHELPTVTEAVADALRIQTLCDHQEGIDSAHILKQADTCKLLAADRELPLPSTFMATVRELGAQHNLIIPPVEINSTDEQNLLQ